MGENTAIGFRSLYKNTTGYFNTAIGVGSLNDNISGNNNTAIGWHIPSDDDWCTLTTYLDNTVDCYSETWSSTDAERKMKETGMVHWNLPNDATNASGFTALGAGYINPSNGYSNGIRTNA